MPRTPRESAPEVTHNLRAWRTRVGMTLEEVAPAIGMTHQNLGKIERGLVPLGQEYHKPLAKLFGIKPADLFRDPDDPAPGEELVPVIGKVGADAEGTVLRALGQTSGDMAPIPPGGTRDAVALEVDGFSMRGVADDGALIYFENQRTPPTPDMLGQVVVVETDGDEVLVKRLLKGSRRGVYDLESINGPTREDVRLRWAAEITAIIPPRQAQRIIRRAGEVQAA